MAEIAPVPDPTFADAHSVKKSKNALFCACFEDPEAKCTKVMYKWEWGMSLRNVFGEWEMDLGNGEWLWGMGNEFG